jgi:hypothetical protein
MFKIAGVYQMMATSKETGDVIGSVSKFDNRKDNIQPEHIQSISNALYQLSRSSNNDLDMNTFEFGNGDKLFTISGGEHVILSAVSDQSAQLGASRLYLKKVAANLEKEYLLFASTQKSVSQPVSRDEELAEIFKQIAGSR